ncbi:sugar transferase [Campylobacter sp. MIT 12-5580]|nr:sugar transferase [Campylobacter sp. MIT 12-5580]
MKPLISIIVPIYNVEKYLRECLDSIVNQTYTNLEIILVNDGSTDSCGAICDEYALKDKRIKVIHKENAGLGAAYNTGLDLASGDYIGFVESDDFIELNMYEQLCERAVKSGVDIVLGGFFFTAEKSNRPYQALIHTIPSDVIFSIEDYPQLLTLHTSLWSKLYKRAVFKNIRVPEFKNSGYYCDFPYWVELVCTAKTMTRINSYLYHYRTDNPNASSTNLRSDSKLLTIIPSIEKAKQTIKQYKKYKLLKEAVYFNSIVTSFRFFANIDPKYKQEFFKGMKNFLEDLRNDKDMEFVYFIQNGWLGQYQFDFVKAVLDDDYKRALELAFIAFTNASSRIQNQLSYRIGYMLVHQIKTFKDVLKSPYLLYKNFREFKKYKKRQGAAKLPNLSQYPDYDKALKIKNHLSYKIGQAVVKYMKMWYFAAPLFLPFKIASIYKNHKKSKSLDANDINKQIINQLNRIENEVLNLKTNIQAAIVHQKSFTSLQGYFQGKKVAIIGTGPSASLYDKPMENTIHIGLNRAFLLPNVKLDFLFINDAMYPDSDALLRRFIINNPDCKVFLGLLPDRFLQSQIHFRHSPNIFSYHNVSAYIMEHIGHNVWAYNLAYEPIADYGNVAFSALQFCCYVDFHQIFLVGIDCSQGHFYNRSDGFILEHNIQTWKKVRNIISKFYPHTQIISINPVGLKGLFKDIYTTKLKKENNEN